VAGVFLNLRFSAFANIPAVCKLTCYVYRATSAGALRSRYYQQRRRYLCLSLYVHRRCALHAVCGRPGRRHPCASPGGRQPGIARASAASLDRICLSLLLASGVCPIPKICLYRTAHRITFMAHLAEGMSAGNYLLHTTAPADSCCPCCDNTRVPQQRRTAIQRMCPTTPLLPTVQTERARTACRWKTSIQRIMTRRNHTNRLSSLSWRHDGRMLG